MAVPTSPRVPVSIYVMWHPNLEEGNALGAALYEWFGDATSDARRIGMGIPVHFRSRDWSGELDTHAVPPAPDVSQPAPTPSIEVERDAWRNRARRDIDYGAAITILVPLVDDHMVADPSWRRDLLAWARRDPGDDEREVDAKELDTFFMPMQLTRAWAQLPDEVRSHKAHYLTTWRDGRSPPPVDELAVRLCRLVTQGLVRRLRLAGSEEGMVTKVFLSHAKADGVDGPGIAERLRDAAASYGQIDKVFYDENDLPSGLDWNSRMLGAASLGVGFISVLSDAYATRYWCRKELASARTPRSLADGAPDPRDVGGAYSVRERCERSVWTLVPTVTVSALRSQWTRFTPELGTAPMMAWRDGCEQEVFDHLFREALIAQFSANYAMDLASIYIDRQVKDPAFFDGRELCLVTWTPDPASVMQLHRQLLDRQPAGGHQYLIAYPGHGFHPTEEESLSRMLGEAFEFVSFEALKDALDPGNGWRPRTEPERSPDLGTWRCVAISAGDPPSEHLAALGYDAPGLDEEGSRDSLHLDNAVLRIMRALLERHVRMFYGGILRKGTGVTAVLRDAALAAFPNGTAPREDTIGSPPGLVVNRARLMENHLAWPFHLKRETYQTAELISLVQDITVPPEGWSIAKARETTPQHMTPQEVAVHTASALTQMRRGIAAETDVTLAMAGKTSGYSGCLPGVAEEIFEALDTAGEEPVGPGNLRVVLIGEFGGVVREIVRFLNNPMAPLPDCLILVRSLTDPANHTVRHLRRTAPTQLESRYKAVHSRLQQLRELIQSMSADTPLPLLGLTLGEWRNLMTTASVGRMRRLLTTVAEQPEATPLTAT